MDIQDRILAKAKELYLQYGIRSITMDMIALQLGISKKTIYHFFADKNDLVDAVIADLLDHNKNGCEHEKSKSDNAIHEVFLAKEMAEHMFRTMNPSLLFDLEKYHPSGFEKYKGFKNEFLYRFIKANLERGLEEGLYRSDIDVEIVCRIRLETMMLPLSPVFSANPKFQTMDVQHQLIEQYLFGVASPEGYRLIQKYKEAPTKKTTPDAIETN